MTRSEHRPPSFPRRALLTWFARAQRDLPWRRTSDPYAIWVSEVMLQQTRVETVIPFYERFLARFPTAEALARASEDEVLSSWSGLGYYRRARSLHAGAREVLASHGGRVPTDAVARRALPGVGRYTAGAIGSIAFGLEEPIVDGNVARVLARWHVIDAPLEHPSSARRLWSLATELVSGSSALGGGGPGALNQALMELGATVCTKATPRCQDCPLRRSCGARSAGRTAELPRVKPKKPPRLLRLVAIVARPAARSRRLWLVRGQTALFGGLFGLPMGEGVGEDDAREVLRASGLRGTVGASAGIVEHVLTHRRLEVQVFGATVRGTPTEERRLLDDEALSSVGVSTLTRKLLARERGA